MIREIERKPIQYKEYWVARVVQELDNKKVVINEKVFETVPTEQDIVEILLTIPKDCFVSIEHNYKLVSKE